VAKKKKPSGNRLYSLLDEVGNIAAGIARSPAKRLAEAMAPPKLKKIKSQGKKKRKK
jgi:hypothetical protein